jgi:hypothetical protein
MRTISFLSSGCLVSLLSTGALFSGACSSSATPHHPVPGTETGGSGGATGGSGGIPTYPGATGGSGGVGGSGGSGSGGGGIGGGSPADAGRTDAAGRVDAGGDGSGGPADAGADAYIRGDGGPFGIAARPPNQTCKPPADVDKPVEKLSATGCVDPTDPKKPAASLIPYDVISPLWSDGAAKQRFMAIPDGALIHVKDCTADPGACKPKDQGGTTPDDGHWELPVGSVLVKSFLFRNKFLETRLFVHFADQWKGYSYQWNDEQTDATIVDEFGLHKMITNDAGGMQDWYFPGRGDCMTCHNETFGFALGTETAQLNRTLAYPSGTTANQLATLEHIGLFDAPVRRIPSLTNPTADTRLQTLEARTRSYLHANCAICHRPEGEYADIDMRFGVALKDMSLCNVEPNKGDVGVPGALRIVPATPAKSVMVLRMLAKDKNAGRMPQVATSVVDTVGVKLVSDWITNNVKTCP